MNPLTLTPFPAARSDTRSHSRLIEDEGFVDESVVRSVMLIQSAPVRRQGLPSDLALAADDLDFAGWHAPQQVPVVLPDLSEHSAEIARIASKPSLVMLRAPVPSKSHGRLLIWVGSLMLCLSLLLIVLLAFERNFTFEGALEKIFPLSPATRVR